MKRLLAVAFALAWNAALFAAPYAGRPLADALRDLETRGLRLIYSSDVVRPDMIVRTEPKSSELRRVLDELLDEHGLRATPGPGGSLVIVRKPQPESAPPLPPVAMMPVSSEEIVVTPSRFSLLNSEPEQRQFMSRDDVRSLPHISDDIYRAIVRVPGTAASDMSARFSIRGGDQDETVVLIDGAEIYDPFHVKDLFRAFSTVDAEAVGAVEILTGGFPAQYGGRLSGVIEMSSLTPTETRTEVGVSLLNTRLLSSGVFHDSRGQWVFSFRRGYLKELLQLIDDTTETNPQYFDLLGKLQYAVGDRHLVSANVMMAKDKIRVTELDAAANARYDDRYAWLNVRSSLTPRLFMQNVVTTGQIDLRRRGQYDEFRDTGRLFDERDFRFTSIKNDMMFDLSPRQAVKAGFTAKRLRASYSYDADALITNAIIHATGPPVAVVRQAEASVSGSDLSAYGAHRIRLTEGVVVEGGVRADRQSYTPDRVHLAPRLNAGVLLGPGTVLRAAWGRFYQPQGVQELQVEDGVTEFHRAQRSDHALVGVDHQFERGITARVEIYEKRIKDPRPRFENLFNKVVLFPEIRSDRHRIDPDSARVRGVELLLRRDGGGPVSGWVSLARSSAVDEIGGRKVPRSWDQPDTLAFSVNVRRGKRWNFNVAGVFHTGWPTTNVEAVVRDGVIVDTVAGPLNADRLSAYKRVDIRASRHLTTSVGGFGFFLELFNALDFKNVTRVSGFTYTRLPDGTIRSQRNTDSVLGVVPSFGVTYQF